MKRTFFLILAASAALFTTAACDPRTESKEPTVTSRATRTAPEAAPPKAQEPAQTAEAQAQPPASPASIQADAFSDTVISARTKAAILSDPGMTGSDVSVNTDRGVVSLTGIIKSQEQAAFASAHAQRQDGVMRVDNHLSVSPT